MHPRGHAFLLEHHPPHRAADVASDGPVMPGADFRDRPYGIADLKVLSDGALQDGTHPLVVHLRGHAIWERHGPHRAAAAAAYDGPVVNGAGVRENPHGIADLVGTGICVEEHGCNVCEVA